MITTVKTEGINPEKRVQVQYEINSSRVKIDYSVFAKTAAEKLELKEAKKDWKKYMRRKVS